MKEQDSSKLYVALSIFNGMVDIYFHVQQNGNKIWKLAPT